MSFLSELKQNIRQSGKVTYEFIAVNVGLFLLFNILFIFERLLFRTGILADFYHDYLFLPGSLDVLITRPWTIITYMFLHAGLFHILFNMLFLFWFGLLLEEYLGRKKIISLYFLGGITGGLLYIISYNIFPYLRDQLEFAFLVGASASVMAILVACATLLPDYTFFLLLLGPVKLKYIALVLVIFDFLSIAGSNPGGMIAHLGGALFGFVFIKQLRKGNDWSQPFIKVVGGLGSVFKRRPPLKVKYSNKDRKNSSPRPVSQQDEIDAILDKISKSGYESLTAEEKNKLFRASGKD
ncbi:membrane associated rhomboid family serine protease [Anseongella ginsenosidimutans]|uniref:Membrane associated rhomboid family serine protease n=1 Tax=Anseongella ginsenosidimutans TaxID=496056 RepID=A0A4R3KQ12_9SPHI|nr:rhomboid family intramembrane serine protease [Anseongella ginsenosidimutans]QEC52299.1 rhomboid family intramembrane serine protease [Anseongella ginsenosidimutans]TCS86858.1 membrane associated rhomboid family serine protease [Anseongella ginsenosidimutans]